MGILMSYCRSNRKRVRFSDNNDHHVIVAKKSANYNQHYRKSLPINRQLDIIEEYMRFCSLLFKGEYLEFVHKPSKGLRNEIIDYICKQQELIQKNQHLCIVY